MPDIEGYNHLKAQHLRENNFQNGTYHSEDSEAKEAKDHNLDLDFDLDMNALLCLETADVTIKEEPLFEKDKGKKPPSDVVGENIAKEMPCKKSLPQKRSSTAEEDVFFLRVTGKALKTEIESLKETNKTCLSDKFPQSGLKISFKCLKCDYETTEEKLLDEHWLTHSKSIDLSEVFRECLSNSKNSDKITNTRETVRKRFKCFHCQFKSNYKKEFDAHSLSHSEGDKKFKCGHCTYETHKESYLKSHIGIHAETKMYPCPHCNYSTHLQSSLKRHSSRTHTENSYLCCTKCDYKIIDKILLDAHMLTHAGIYKFICSECGFKTNLKNRLTTHMVMNHEAEKPYQCSLCDYGTTIKCHLESHLLDHEGVKRFKCPECNYETNRKENMKTHLFIHSGKKRFKCPECDHETNRKYNLDLHLRTHLNHSEKEKKEEKSGQKTKTKEVEEPASPLS